MDRWVGWLGVWIKKRSRWMVIVEGMNGDCKVVVRRRRKEVEVEEEEVEMREIC